MMGKTEEMKILESIGLITDRLKNAANGTKAESHSSCGGCGSCSGCSSGDY